jgi:hypothetical protein
MRQRPLQIVLSRPKLRDVFHTLLFALACFDILFLVFGGISYTFRDGLDESPSRAKFSSNFYPKIFGQNLVHKLQ